MSDDTFLETFDPADWPGGIVCIVCEVPLTRENVMRVDITDDPEEVWVKLVPDDPRLFELMCMSCVIEGCDV